MCMYIYIWIEYPVWYACSFHGHFLSPGPYFLNPEAEPVGNWWCSSGFDVVLACLIHQASLRHPIMLIGDAHPCWTGLKMAEVYHNLDVTCWVCTWMLAFEKRTIHMKYQLYLSIFIKHVVFPRMARRQLPFGSAHAQGMRQSHLPPRAQFIWKFSRHLAL
jgi:hypothetical protein